MQSYPKVKTYSTRFQGSKKRVIDWLSYELGDYFPEEKTVFDAFAGTGVVSYALALQGRDIIACDQLRSPEISLRAFIGNRSDLDLKKILRDIEKKGSSPEEKEFLRIYKGIFFTDDELRFLVCAARYARDDMKEDDRSAFLWSLFQSALAKRPYNLFHRANLSIRQKSVKRSFGNKTTWEKSFADHLEKFIKEQKKYAIKDHPRPRFLHGDILRHKQQDCDLVYLDPPYITGKGVATPYLDFYGFLDILLDPDLLKRVDESKAHRPLVNLSPSGWENSDDIIPSFQKLLETYQDKAIVISYRDDGFPGILELEDILQSLGKQTEVKSFPIQYALSKNKANEALILAR
jgi:adenine-specific DNA-methyltransferase